jgi:hypothetical protein
MWGLGFLHKHKNELKKLLKNTNQFKKKKKKKKKKQKKKIQK